MQPIEFRLICLVVMIFCLEDGVMKMISSAGHSINALLMIVASSVYIIVISKDILSRN